MLTDKQYELRSNKSPGEVLRALGKDVIEPTRMIMSPGKVVGWANPSFGTFWLRMVQSYIRGRMFFPRAEGKVEADGPGSIVRFKLGTPPASRIVLYVAAAAIIILPNTVPFLAFSEMVWEMETALIRFALSLVASGAFLTINGFIAKSDLKLLEKHIRKAL